MDTRRTKFVLAGAVLAMSTAGATSALAASIPFYMDASDAAGISSFNSGTNWVGDAAPVAATPPDTNDYFASNSDNSIKYSIRTPSSGAAYTFQGDSLHLTGTGSALRLKGPTGQSISVNLIMEALSAITNDAVAASYTLEGDITVNGDPNTTSVNIAAVGGVGQTITINSALTGGGALRLSRGGGNGAFILNSAGNTNGGKVLLEGVPLTVTMNGGLGTANVSMFVATNNPVLTLQSVTDNNFFSDLASLTVPSTGTVNLNFTGIDVLGSVTVGATIYTDGTIGAIGSNATHEDAVFTGTGLLAVPEPASLGLLGLSVVALRRRRH